MTSPRQWLRAALAAQAELGLREVPARWLALAAPPLPGTRPVAPTPPPPAASSPAGGSGPPAGGDVLATVSTRRGGEGGADDHAERPPRQPATVSTRPGGEGGAGCPPAHGDELATIATLDRLAALAAGCRRCPLASRRHHVVFGAGDPAARLLVVGEAPGADEDLQGLPFVGRAGKLLTDILAAIGLARPAVYIANVLKCRPPENRNPEVAEIAACRPFLDRQIELIAPAVILTLGTFATQVVLNTDAPIGALRGRFHDRRSTPVLPTYHPAYLLRNPAAKRAVWEDIKQVGRRLGLPEPFPGERGS
ncbi:MAG: hypothetical protein COW73_02770 [Nitrospirae bacterium CG18_big_fil_WC_8_21_14_2_50_70_55]|nr:uracil-DNA glycosylase [Deltaproteobacteria bacterium]PIQ06683.1 MAG: hypothetical protein COW73_02770 [Nitrospirae bacterium CG18_big_fil_WC_8_21_14_2_50_70_55]PIU77727.1 MAG: hypothetical protein COS73_09240 [Nitrospirae bacterium CG06_land_8_20_14_3_00_70_43]PIW82824.1 MAG: hypothetical protein COZ96_06700 [Nitrospirae bacterium CG_4_8_14_3_um_filter_70_85]PIX83611.1 MAG: hypothetical protein COZ33_04550 [Nitrospirae bacterium CG_4_10_14_3_um_filter_70_108]